VLVEIFTVIRYIFAGDVFDFSEQEPCS